MKYYTKPQLVEIFSYDEIYAIWESLGKPREFAVGEHYKIMVKASEISQLKDIPATFCFDDCNCVYTYLFIDNYIMIEGINNAWCFDRCFDISKHYTKVGDKDNG